jgi:hypothetical protein
MVLTGRRREGIIYTNVCFAAMGADKARFMRAAEKDARDENGRGSPGKGKMLWRAEKAWSKE